MADPAPVRIIAFLNQKGGVGKTTTTVNLAAALAEAGRRVLLVDLDPQAHATLHLGVDVAAPPEGSEAQAGASVYDLFLDAATPIEAVLRRARPNLDVVPSTVDLAAAESELAGERERNGILAARLAPILGRYEFVLLDCPPSLGLLTLNALALAREVMVPMQAHFLALQGVGKLLETVGLVAQSVNPALRVTGIVLCMHEPNVSHQKEVVADLDAFFEQARGSAVPWSVCRVMRPAIRRNIKLAEAPSFGQSIFDYAPWCPGAVDYRRLAEQIAKEWDALTAKRSAGRARAAPPAPSTTAAPPTPSAQSIESKPLGGTGDRSAGAATT